MAELVTHPLAVKKGWVVGVDYPEWGNNAYYLTTIQGSYLVDRETPREAYLRLATTASKHLASAGQFVPNDFFYILWKGWLIPSTPVMCNMGTDRGLPISCFSGVVGDDMYDIYRKNLEMAMLSKHGGGTAYDFSYVRPIGTLIKGGKNGTSDGIVPFIKSYDSTILASKQGKTRRGAVAIYLDAWHEEFKEFLRLRTGEGEIDRQCHTIHQGAKFDDKFMNLVKSKNGKERELWLDTLKARIKTGEPYVMFTDNANRDLPAHWAKHDLSIKHSNLCSEIFLPTDENHTLVCCLSSMNLYKWDEWKDTDAVKLAICFLDAVITEFLEKSAHIKGIEDARAFARKSRALGLGTLGWHTLLKSKMIPFVGIQADSLTRIIFKHIRDQADEASKQLAHLFGEPEWMEGTGERNLTKLAIAPNRSSAQLAGGVSQSVEPDTANLFVDDTAKGMHLKADIILQQLLASKGMDTREVWEQIEFDNGSVANIKDLTDDEKEVFRTAREINQLELVKQAGIRQTYLDQGQSINLFFYQDAPAKFINQVHIEAWERGLKALYYLKSESKLKADKAKQRDLYSECISCEA
jgi:ribonucleoside-diphosphate reductase alpha chain